MENLQFISELPASRVPYPSGIQDRIKYWLWRVISRPFPYVRDLLVRAHIIRHHIRQHYLLGKFDAKKDFQLLIAHLETRGFGNHFIAWRDEGEAVSLRRLDGFERQYHIRVFNDGEVRGHYEYTPESHPIQHFKEIDIEERRADFLEFLGDWITPS